MSKNHLRRPFVILGLTLIAMPLVTAVLAQTAEPAASNHHASAAAVEQNIQFLGHIGGSVEAVTVHGNRVFAGEGPKLTIFDISDAANPRVLGKTGLLPGMVRDLAVAGYYLTPGPARAVAAVGDKAYVAGSQDGLLVLATIRDITRRKREEQELLNSQQQLRELSARLLTVNEEERARFSYTIHEELGQMMIGLKLDLDWLEKRFGPDQETLLEKAKTMSQLIDAIIKGMRQISTELRPGILDDIGLEAAVEWQLLEFQRQNGIRCTLIGNMKMQDGLRNVRGATVAFRILQEILANIVRHAGASHVEVVLTKNAGEMTLLVHDDGRGITAGEIDDPRSIGLLGMRERARTRGGLLEIKGVAGNGTTITLRLPLTTDEEKQRN